MNIAFITGSYQIAADGKITRTAKWKISADSQEHADVSWNGFEQRVKSWAGTTGEPWREPAANSVRYILDAAFSITSITVNLTGTLCYEVNYTAAGNLALPRPYELTEFKNADGRNEKTAKWLVRAIELQERLPDNGDLVEWAGANWRCKNSTVRHLDNNQAEITICAVDTTTIMLGAPAWRHTAEYEHIAVAKWQLDQSCYQDFLNMNPIGGDASGWAGADYRITRVNAASAGGALYEIEVEATDSSVRLLEITCVKQFTGYDFRGAPRIETVWRGRWKINRAAMEEFSALPGVSAADWAAENCVVTSAVYTGKNNLDYECSLEAKPPEEHFADMPESDNLLNSNYAERRDVALDTGTFLLFPENAGWELEYSGRYQRQTSWDASTACPFITAEPLPFELVNRELLCVVLTVTQWRRGNLHEQIAVEIDWSATGKIVHTAEGFPGNWRKTDLNAVPVADNNGDIWTKITRQYQHSPEQLSWNPLYWR